MCRIDGNVSDFAMLINFEKRLVSGALAEHKIVSGAKTQLSRFHVGSGFKALRFTGAAYFEQIKRGNHWDDSILKYNVLRGAAFGG